MPRNPLRGGGRRTTGRSSRTSARVASPFAIAWLRSQIDLYLLWAFTKGHTKTTVNYALATFAALRQTGQVKVRSEQTERLKIKAGAEQVFTRKVEAPPVVADAVPPGELPEEIAVEGEALTEEPAADPKDEEAPEE